jgi:ACS family hexuronate transporter-like MFS transporter
MSSIADTPPAAPTGRVGKYRWVIVALLFVATVINYVDRQMLGVLKPLIQDEVGWSEIDYGNIVFYFQLTYSIFYLLFGAFVDKAGAKIGYGIAFVFWQLAHIAHAGARELGHWYIVRMALGIGEAGNFPGGLKAITEWFPKKERAFAIGVFNAGSNIGAIICPIVAPMIYHLWGWQMAFIITGVIGMFWIIAWLLIYKRPEEHPKVGAAELAHIQQDPPDDEKKVGWFSLLPKKETWAYSLGKFLIDPVWWMLLFWLPSFFKSTFTLDIPTYTVVLATVYLISDVGSVAGGWLSSTLIRRGASVNVGRKVAMLVCAVLAVPYLFITSIDNLWIATIVVGIVAAAHQGFSANLYAIPGDVFPRRANASVVGIGGMLGGVGGMIMAKSVGWVLETIGGYTQIFFVCGLIYLLALAVVHVLSPRLEPVRI